MDNSRYTAGRNCNTAVSKLGGVQLRRCNIVSAVNMEDAHFSRIHDIERGVYGYKSLF